MLTANDPCLNLPEALLQDMPVLIYSADPVRDCTTTYISPNVKDVLGYSPNEILGVPRFWCAILHPDDRQTMVDFLKAPAPGKHTFEYRLKKKDGSYVWIQDEKRIVSDADGKIIEIVGTKTDVTLLHDRFDALIRQMRRYETIFHTAASGIAICDMEGKFQETNEMWSRIFGYPPEELQGHTPVDYIHPEEKQDCREAMFTLLQGNVDHLRDQKRFVRRNGEEFWADVVCRRIQNSDNTPGGIVCVLNDITESKATAEALANSEQEKETILNTIADGVTFQSPDNTVLWANQAVSNASELPLEEIVGQKCHHIWNRTDAPCPDCPAKKCFELGEPVASEARSINDRVWQVKAYPTRLSSDSSPGVLVVSSDITEQKRTEEEMRKAKELAEKATHMKDMFMANMSHELRSPLNGMLGMLDVLLDTNLDEEQRDCIETALQAGEGLLAIINDILDFSKLQKDKIVLSRHEFELHRTVRTVCNTYREQSRRKGINVTFNIDKNVPENVIGDEGRIRQILFNLVGNSVKFTKKGNVNVDVFILRKSTARKNARLLFTVTDTGIGIPEDELETIFDPFIQLDWAKSRKYEGTGLGLAIVKRLVTLMGGIITVESKPNVGTTINFWINAQLPE